VIQRRAFVICGMSLLVAPLGGEAQQAGKIARIGRLSPVSVSADVPIVEALRQGLRDLGWIEGQNFAFENRFAEGKFGRLPELAAELVRLKVDVIVAGSPNGALAAKDATSTIPIVMVTSGDPVASGLVASLARPGANLTGLTALVQALSEKRLALLKEAAPGVTRVAVLFNPAILDPGPSVKGVEAAARALGLQLRVLEVRDPTELENAFAAIESERARALMVLEDIMLDTHRTRVVELVAKSRLPAMYALRAFVDAGGLMFYGARSQHVQARRRLRGQDLEGRQAARPPRRAAHEVRTRHQHEDRQDARADNPAIAAATGGSGDRVITRHPGGSST